MLKIMQKGGKTLTNKEFEEIKNYLIIISGNGDCLFGSAFRGILEIYNKEDDTSRFPINPFKFFKNKGVNINDLLEIKNLDKDEDFKIAVRNFRRYLYNCIIEFLNTNNYTTIFEVFNFNISFDFFDFVFHNKNEMTNSFSQLFNSIDYKYSETENGILENKFIDIFKRHFQKMKVENSKIEDNLSFEYYGGQIELIFISYLFDVIFYYVNEQNESISENLVGNPSLDFSRAIPLFYKGAHYDSLKLDVINSTGFFGELKSQQYLESFISESTINKIKASRFNNTVSQEIILVDKPPHSSLSSSQLSGQPTGQPSGQPTDQPFPPPPPLTVELTADEFQNNFNKILDKLVIIKNLGNIYEDQIYKNFIEKLNLTNNENYKKLVKDIFKNQERKSLKDFLEFDLFYYVIDKDKYKHIFHETLKIIDNILKQINDTLKQYNSSVESLQVIDNKFKNIVHFLKNCDLLFIYNDLINR